MDGVYLSNQSTLYPSFYFTGIIATAALVTHLRNHFMFSRAFEQPARFVN